MDIGFIKFVALFITLGALLYIICLLIRKPCYLLKPIAGGGPFNKLGTFTMTLGTYFIILYTKLPTFVF